MPIVPTWLNDEDYTKYLVVKGKAKGAWTEFIHNALNGIVFKNKDYTITQAPIIITSPGHKAALEKLNKTTPIFEDGRPIPKSFSARKKKK